MNKKEKWIAIKEQSKAEKTNTLCPLINTKVLIVISFCKGVGCGFVVNAKRYVTAKNML